MDNEDELLDYLELVDNILREMDKNLDLFK